MVTRRKNYKVEIKLAETLSEIEKNLNLLIDILDHSGYTLISHSVVQSIKSPNYYIVTVVGCK